VRRSGPPVLALGLLLGACTDARLFGDARLNPPDVTDIEGSICTSDPAEQAFPVRVLFLVDTSVADAGYVNQRGDAIERVVRSFSGPNYSYGIIRYSGPLRGTVCGFRNLTPDGFTKSVEEAVAGVRCADAQNPGRDLIGALSLANSMISGDVLATPLGTRSRTKYVVVMLTNGNPSVDVALQWCRSRAPPIADNRCPQAYFDRFCGELEPPPADCGRYQYVRVVREMRRFAIDNGAQEFFFHPVYQRDPDDATAGRDADGVLELLGEMALVGNGSVYSFPTGGRCDVMGGDGAGCLFSAIDFDSTQAVFQRKQLIASNRSALATGRGLKPDTDQDGLDDETELELGTDPTRRDTDGDTLSDRLEWLLFTGGLDPTRDELTDTSSSSRWPIECPRPGSGNPRAFPPDQDLDGDGLTDCEEILLRSDPTLFDTDADGIPDPLEFRYGTNPIAPDILADDDADGLANLEEFKFHLAPRARDPNTDRVYRYDIRNEAAREVVAFTQPFQLTGVYITEVSPASTEGRATLFYRPAPDPLAPLSATNAAALAWRDPQDMTPSGAFPGRGPDVPITGDGLYVIPSAGSPPDVPELERSVSVDVFAEQLPRRELRNDVRLRRSTRTCFDFTIDGVRLVDTLEQPDTGLAGVNFIDVFLAEVPVNNPNGYGVFRAATIPVLLDPVVERRRPQPTIELITEDFLLFGD
jgi:hypothetical protein